MAASQDSIKVLFLGNSLSYTNDLPGLFDEAIAHYGLKARSSLIAKPNYSLEDHWKEGEVQKHIEEGEFDYLVIQQGPSSQADGRSSLLEFGGKLKSLISKSGGELVFFMVWPSRRYHRTFEGVINNYTNAAKTHNAVLAPVGLKLKEALTKNQDFEFLGGDGFHPNLKGSKYAAEIIAESIFLAQQ